MIYYFYSKSDIKKEPIKKLEASNKNKAILYFASMKQLLIDDFLKLYNVEGIEK